MLGNLESKKQLTIMSTSYKIKHHYKEFKRFVRFVLFVITSKYKTRHNNFTCYLAYDKVETESWLTHFIKLNVKEYIYYCPIDFFFQYVDPKTIGVSGAKNKIVIITENNHVPLSTWWKYLQIQDKKGVSLVLGFDYINHHHYLRFPYWLFTNFTPDVTQEDVKEYVRKYNYSNPTGKSKFCSFICRKDYFGDRKYLADLIAEEIGELSYPSDFRHNDDDLRVKYKNDKIAYLSEFKFNLCPENSDNEGYVTEKIFDAIKAGCIPIYWGSEGNPEPEILNPDAIIFLKRNGDNSEALKLINRLNESEELYKEFISRPRFTPNAHKFIYDFFVQLKRKLNTTMR